MKDLIDTNPAALILMLCTAASAYFMGFVWLPRYLRKTKRLLRYSKFQARARQRC